MTRAEQAEVWAAYFERCREQGRKEARREMPSRQDVSQRELDLMDRVMDLADEIVTRRNIMRTEWTDGDWRMVLKVTGEQIDKLANLVAEYKALEARSGNGS